MRAEDVLGEQIRVWDAQHSSVFVEGKCVAWVDGPVVFVESACSCGERKLVGHRASLPIDVSKWIPAADLARWEPK